MNTARKWKKNHGARTNLQTGEETRDETMTEREIVDARESLGSWRTLPTGAKLPQPYR
ncbi:hypothetical protein J6590_007314, partial [Homalodisca vitripennis]